MLAILENGDLYSWGRENDSKGRLGLGRLSETVSTPTKVQGFLSNEKVRKVACGQDHTIVLTDLNNCYAFGESSVGRLGIGKVDEPIHVPTLIEDLQGVLPLDVACGVEHTVLVAEVQH